MEAEDHKKVITEVTIMAADNNKEVASVDLEDKEDSVVPRAVLEAKADREDIMAAGNILEVVDLEVQVAQEAKVVLEALEGDGDYFEASRWMGYEGRRTGE